MICLANGCRMDKHNHYSNKGVIMIQTINNWKKRFIIVAMVLVTGVTGTLIAPPTASAAGCRKTDVGMNNGYFTNQYAYFAGESVYLWYTDWIKSPSWATSCRDVNIGNVYVPGDPGYQCADFRARRYWDNKVSDWVRICNGSSWRVIFSGIYGSTYRVEVRPEPNANYRPYYTIMD